MQHRLLIECMHSCKSDLFYEQRWLHCVIVMYSLLATVSPVVAFGYTSVICRSLDQETQEGPKYWHIAFSGVPLIGGKVYGRQGSWVEV